VGDAKRIRFLPVGAVKRELTLLPSTVTLPPNEMINNNMRGYLLGQSEILHNTAEPSTAVSSGQLILRTW
jgi:hypothetical protein